MFIVKKGRGCEFVVDMGEALCWFMCAQKVHLQKFTHQIVLAISRDRRDKNWLLRVLKMTEGTKQTAWTTRFGRKQERKKKNEYILISSQISWNSPLFGFKNNKICRKKFSGPIVFFYVHNNVHPPLSFPRKLEQQSHNNIDAWAYLTMPIPKVVLYLTSQQQLPFYFYVYFEGSRPKQKNPMVLCPRSSPIL